MIANFFKITALWVMFSLSGPVYAVSSFCRACNMAELNEYGVLKQALYFFNMIGMPDNYLDISKKSDAEKRKYWVNESFTLDVSNVPVNYLYAASRVYKKPEVSFGGGPNLYGFYKDYVSGYDSKKYSDFALNDRLIEAVIRRHLVYFARAGESQIIDYILEPSEVKVYGIHYYVNAVTKVRVDLPDSSAVNCNALGGMPKWPA